MNEVKSKNIKFLSQQDAVQYYQKQMEAYLELRLLSRQNNEMKNFSSEKNKLRKNIARALTYLNQKWVKVMIEKKKKLFCGRVIRKKMEKTVTVVVERVFRHLVLQKVIRKQTKFHVHDPLNQASIGDEILFYEGPHISKIKYMYFYDKINIEKQKSIQK